MSSVSPFAIRHTDSCARVSPALLRKAFYGVMHRIFGEAADFQVLRIIPDAVMEFCDAEDGAEVYALTGRVIGLVRVLSTPRGRMLARVTGSEDLERAIEVASYLPLSDDLRFNEARFWGEHAKSVKLPGR